MLTAAAMLLSIATAAPVAPAAATPTGADAPERSPSRLTTTLAAALPTPGAWALMGLGGLALVRARRAKR